MARQYVQIQERGPSRAVSVAQSMLLVYCRPQQCNIVQDASRTVFPHSLLPNTTSYVRDLSQGGYDIPPPRYFDDMRDSMDHCPPICLQLYSQTVHISNIAWAKHWSYEYICITNWSFCSEVRAGRPGHKTDAVCRGLAGCTLAKVIVLPHMRVSLREPGAMALAPVTDSAMPSR